MKITIDIRTQYVGNRPISTGPPPGEGATVSRSVPKSGNKRTDGGDCITLHANAVGN